MVSSAWVEPRSIAKGSKQLGSICKAASGCLPSQRSPGGSGADRMQDCHTVQLTHSGAGCSMVLVKKVS
jgi:hypothetical protein